jgi:hypothetical protein
MYRPSQWGNVNLGVDVLQGHGEQSPKGAQQFYNEHPGMNYKEQYNPGRNQELNINPEEFVMRKSEQTGAHDRIKEMLGSKNISRKQAVKTAMREARDSGKISPKDVYRYKFQAEQPGRQMSPFRTQEQEFPFI